MRINTKHHLYKFSRDTILRELPGRPHINCPHPSLESLVKHSNKISGEINFWHVFSDMRKLETGKLSNSIEVFNYAVKLIREKSFSYDVFARDAYEDYFNSKIDSDSKYTTKDLLALAALANNLKSAQAHEISIKLGLSEKEADCVSYLVKNMGIPEQMSLIYNDEDIIRYLKSIDFDLGLPFLNLAMSKGKDPSIEETARSIINFPFTLCPVPTVHSGVSLLDQLEMVSPIYKTIYAKFDFTSEIGASKEFADFVRIEHLLFLDRKIAATQRKIDASSFESRKYFEGLLEKARLEKDEIIADADKYEERIKNAAARVVLVRKDNFNDLPWAYDYSKFKDEIPILLWPYSYSKKMDLKRLDVIREKLLQNIKMRDLKNITENNRGHRNCDVFTHTNKAINAAAYIMKLNFIPDRNIKEKYLEYLRTIEDKYSKNKYTRYELLYAAVILHDIGKGMADPQTGRPVINVKKDGTTTAIGHANAGAPLAEEIAKVELGCSEKEAKVIKHLVHMHMYGFGLLDNIKKSETDSTALEEKFLKGINYNPLLILLMMADNIGTERGLSLSKLKVFNKLINRLF